MLTEACVGQEPVFFRANRDIFYMDWEDAAQPAAMNLRA